MLGEIAGASRSNRSMERALTTPIHSSEPPLQQLTLFPAIYSPTPRASMEQQLSLPIPLPEDYSLTLIHSLGQQSLLELSSFLAICSPMQTHSSEQQSVPATP